MENVIMNTKANPLALVIAENVTPTAAANKLSEFMDKPAAYAAAIVARGMDFCAAVCAAINAKHETAESRRPLYRVLHQAATRANAPFSFVSRKHSGLDVQTIARDPGTGDAGDTGDTENPGNPEGSTEKPQRANWKDEAAKLALQVKALQAALATAERERDEARHERDEARKALAKLERANKPASKPARVQRKRAA